MQTSFTCSAAELEGINLNSKELGEDDVEEAEYGGNQVGGEVLEPYEGIEFDSEDDARKFYNDYARRIGFVVRLMTRRLSFEGKVVARVLGCNKQGFASSTQDKIGPARKPRPSSRGGCNATILFRVNEAGKWVCTRFEKEHNHPLVVTCRDSTNMLDKNKKIQELTRELQSEEELCAAYRQRLISILAYMENQTEHLSSKVQIVVENLKKAEAETLAFRNRR